jgi:ATP-dependent DNA ligase
MSNFTMPSAAVLAEIPRATSASQIVSSGAEPPAGDGWLHEIKHDGHRLLAIIAAGEPRLISRNGHDRTRLFHALFQPRGGSSRCAPRCR